ncbi:MAG: maleylpyruvate isomerase family mycothiol-dependent enzyme [Acidimicrobiales bacterium]
MDTWLVVDEERSALAEDLATLDDSQWNAQSLCSEWKVRHVVGHLIGGADLKAVPFFAGLCKSGMNFNRFMARQGLALGIASPDELLRQFRKTIGMHSTPPGANSEIMLIDIVCHSGDIRRPTGMTRKVPEAALLTVADLVKRVGFPLQAKKRIAGLRLSATDSDWSAGDGPTVEGPLASLILVMAGRIAALGDLSGEGRQILQTRA